MTLRRITLTLNDDCFKIIRSIADRYQTSNSHAARLILTGALEEPGKPTQPDWEEDK